MNLLKLLIQSAEKKLFQIETELFLLREQLNTISLIPGISEIESNCLMLEYNINFVKRKYLLNYLKSLKESCKEKCSFNDSILIHISALDDGIISSFLFEVSGHQNALADMTDTTLFNNDGKPENILLSVKRFFPYDMILPLLHNVQFMTKFLKIVFDDSIDDHNKYVHDVISLFSFNRNNINIFYVVLEVLISYFRPDIIKNEQIVITDFSFYEKCRILMKEKYDIIKEKVLQNINFESKLSQSEDTQYSVRSFTKEIKLPYPFDIDIDKNNITECFQHIISELQKISVQNSYSMICLSFIRISDYLTMTLSALKSVSIIGADETFHILIYILCSSRISNFVSTLEFVDKNCPSFLTESRTGYLIEQMKSAMNFLNSIVISPKDKIILPFLFQEGATKVLLNDPRLSIILYPNESIPAVFMLSEVENSESENKEVIGYLQSFEKELLDQCKDVRLINTTKGLLPLYFGEKNYKKVDDNDYEKYIASMI
ncbi:hypothetical protein M9Y10_041706 [Tritrichomonas musculus]|uniref:VPS9 domain-containing protein n=1 Tax=Tritrichomonas musculus TaxID=1915356 RepID=A0ABR2K6W7_9EUKA